MSNQEKYEYKVISQRDKFWGNRYNPEEIEAHLNELGEQGWEFVLAINSDSAGVMTNRSEMIMIFKRKKQEQ